MKRVIRRLAAIVIVLVAAAAYHYAHHTTVLLHSDLYPLYSGVTWGKVTSSKFDDLSGYETTSLAAVNTTDIGAAAIPFIKYYDAKLTAAGWTEDVSRDADGPGDAITFYKKGDSTIVISYTSDFKVSPPDAADECPCDVTLSVFSSSPSTIQ